MDANAQYLFQDLSRLAHRGRGSNITLEEIRARAVPVLLKFKIQDLQAESDRLNHGIQVGEMLESVVRSD